MNHAAKLSALQAELVGFDALLALLRDENRLLLDGNTAALPEITQKKDTLINQLDQQAMERTKWLPAESEALTKLLALHPDIAVLWSSLTEQAKQASALNQLNGKIINQRLQHNREALNILRGQEGNQNIYGPDGQPLEGASGRTLGSA